MAATDLALVLAGAGPKALSKNSKWSFFPQLWTGRLADTISFLLPTTWAMQQRRPASCQGTGSQFPAIFRAVMFLAEVSTSSLSSFLELAPICVGSCKQEFKDSFSFSITLKER